jgi:hypothetical protein
MITEKMNEKLLRKYSSKKLLRKRTIELQTEKY